MKTAVRIAAYVAVWFGVACFLGFGVATLGLQPGWSAAVAGLAGATWGWFYIGWALVRLRRT